MGEVACFRNNGDVRKVSLLAEEGGGVEVREDLSGPSTLVAYGEDERSLRVQLGAEGLAAAEQALGAAGGPGTIASYLSSEERDLTDLMDFLDAHEVPYAFASVGPKSGICLRPA